MTSAEHLLNAHPSIVVHLCLLFNGIASHGLCHCQVFVFYDFGSGIIIPLIKDKLGNKLGNDLGNNRGITLIPVIAKLFELVPLEICESSLKTDDLQFGFRQNLRRSTLFLF